MAQNEAYPYTNKQIQTTSFSPKPIVVFTFDDAPTEDLTVIKPIFDSFGYKGTIYAIPGLSGTRRVSSGYTIDYMTKEQLHIMANAGWEIGAHTMTHIIMGGASEETIEYEMGESKKVLQNWGFKVTNFAYPFGGTDDLSKRIATKYFRTATLFGGPKTTISPPLNKPAVPRKSLGSFFDPVTTEFPTTNTFDNYYKHWVDDAVANNDLTVFALHSFATNDEQLGYLRATLQYCHDSDVDVMTLNEALDYFDNTLDIKAYNTDNSVKSELIFGADGGGHSEHLTIPKAIQSTEWKKYTDKTLPIDYPNGLSYLVSKDKIKWPMLNGTVIVYTEKMFGAVDLTRQWVSQTWATGMAYRTAKPDGTWNDFVNLTGSSFSLSAYKPFSATGATSIPAGGRLVLEVPNSTVIWSATVTGNTNRQLPAGIVYDCYNNGGNGIRIEIQNLSAVSVSLPATTEFNIKAV